MGWCTILETSIWYVPVPEGVSSSRTSFFFPLCALKELLSSKYELNASCYSFTKGQTLHRAAKNDGAIFDV